jgi:hypothetical protein
MNRLSRSYATLGLSPGASFREVRQSYLRLVREWHPDRFADDPPRQRLAQEQLKTINEAYRVLEEALAGGDGPPSAAVPSPSPPPRARAETAAEPVSGQEKGGREPGGLVRFLSFWPNVLFLVYLLFAARMAAARGDLFYFLQMAAVPAIFALLCSTRLGMRQSIWKAYVAAICIFAVLLAADASMMRKGGREAWGPRYPDRGEPMAPTVTGPSGVPVLPELLPGDAGTGAPNGMRQVTPPTPPTAPEAPDRPDAPVAPVAPRGR